MNQRPQTTSATIELDAGSEAPTGALTDGQDKPAASAAGSSSPPRDRGLAHQHGASRAKPVRDRPAGPAVGQHANQAPKESNPMRHILRRLARRHGTAVAYLALFAALGGSAYAAVTVTGKNIKDGTVTGRDVKNSSLGTGKLSPSAVSSLRPGLAGPQGEKGPAGPAGATGPAGPTDPRAKPAQPAPPAQKVRKGPAVSKAQAGSWAGNTRLEWRASRGSLKPGRRRCSVQTARGRLEAAWAAPTTAPTPQRTGRSNLAAAGWSRPTTPATPTATVYAWVICANVTS